jgi:hypothetical protein
MHWTDSLISVPRFSQRPSGLLVPTDLDRPAIGPGDRLSDGTPIAKDAFFVMSKQPSSTEQMRVVIDEAGVGLPVSSLERLRRMATALDFENSMLAISRLACHAWQMRGDTDRQLALAPAIFGDADLVAAISRLARNKQDPLEIFPEQHAAVLQRLLVLLAHESAAENDRDAEQVIFNRAWLAAAAPSGDFEAVSPTDPGGRQDWIAYFIQNGTYNRTEDSLSAMTRHQILLGDIASSDAAKDHPHFCDVENWHREAFGLGLADQFSLGLTVSGRAGVFNKEMPIEDRSLVGRAYLANVAENLGCDFDRVSELISAPRNWYISEFDKREDNAANTAWDRIPFEVRPLLQLSTGEFLAVSPRALENWQGEGFYHRTVAAARERHLVERFQAFYGWLVEEYVLRVLRYVHPDPDPAALASCRVFGEQRYGRGAGKLSPDVVVDCGPDLVVMEVYSGRFTLRTVVEGDAEAALEDLGRLIFNKATQLDRRLTEYLDGEWSLPGVSLDRVERIWPVIVSADVLQNEMLWDETRERLSNVLKQPKVQRLTLLDIGDLEQLAALVECGHGLVDLIARKANGAYSDLDFRRFVADTANLPSEVRLSMLNDRWFSEMDRTAEAFGIDTSSRDAVDARKRARELT